MTVGNSKGRIQNFDVLRGFLIVAACFEHFSGYISFWYLQHFRETGLLGSLYEAHIPYVGRVVPIDPATQVILWFFMPWITHLYIALAAFNLASRDQAEMKAVYAGKMKVFGLLFVAFSIENAVVSTNFGGALSFHPLQAWMVILMLLATAHRFCGARGVAVLFAIAWLRYVVPVDEWNVAFNLLIKTNVHPGFQYDTAVDLFLPSGSFGFLLGRAYSTWGRGTTRWLMVLMGGGAVAVVVYLVVGTMPFPDPRNLYATEYDVARDPVGMVGILGMLSMVIGGFLAAEVRGRVIRSTSFAWIGRNSLFVFLSHRIVFIYLVMPVREYVGNWFEVPVQSHVAETIAYTVVVVTFCYWTVRSGLARAVVSERGTS